SLGHSHIHTCIYIPFLLSLRMRSLFFFFFNDPAPTEIYTLSLHDALPISAAQRQAELKRRRRELIAVGVAGLTLVAFVLAQRQRSEEHTSELQSRENLVCRLLLEKKKKKKKKTTQKTKSNNTMKCAYHSST